MIVLGVLAVALLLAAPTFENLLQGTLEREFGRLAGVMRLLRNEAVLRNTRFRMMLDLREHRYTVERINDVGDYDRLDHPAQLRPHTFPASIAIRDVMVLGEIFRPDRFEKPVPINIDGSGYVDPFLLHFTFDEADYTLKVTGFTGRMELLDGYVDR